MRAGRLRHVVDVDEPVTVQDDTGAEVVTWTLLDSVRAEIHPLNGHERLVAGGESSTMDTRITIRWSPNVAQINAKWRLRHQGVIYNIESVDEIDMRRQEIELMCQSGVNLG